MRVASVPPMLKGEVSGYLTTDYFTEASAARLAAIIVAAWQRAGRADVVAWIERIPGHRSWSVRTNLVSGLPRPLV